MRNRFETQINAETNPELQVRIVVAAMAMQKKPLNGMQQTSRVNHVTGHVQRTHGGRNSGRCDRRGASPFPVIDKSTAGADHDSG